MATETDRMDLADEIEQATAEWPEQSVVGVYRTAAEWREVIAALRSEAGAAMRERCAAEAEADRKVELPPVRSVGPFLPRPSRHRAPHEIATAIRSLPLQPEGGEA